MARIILFTLLNVLWLVGLSGVASANPQDSFKKTILIQNTIRDARNLLFKSEPAKAVQLLEDNLPIINGHPGYLMILREAYHAYIMELSTKGPKELRDKYLGRLEILEPTASKDPALLPPVVTEQPPKSFPTNAELASMPPAPQVPPLGPKVFDNSPMAVSTLNNLKVRGVAPEPAKIDPFSPANQMPSAVLDANPNKKQALALLAQAEAEYKLEHYLQARQLFEQVHQMEPQYTVPSRSRWAYCKLKFVEDTLNQPNVPNSAWENLEKEVRAAASMAPNLPKMEESSKFLLAEISKRRGLKQGGTAELEAVKHFGSNAEGWQLAEGKYFRVYHKQSAEVGGKVVQVAEHTRGEVHRKWFGNQPADWATKCDIYVYNNAAEYTQQHKTVAPGTPGHSHIESDRVSLRVVCRRIFLHCENLNWLETVLPHETTHVVIASQFGSPQVPRWVDEGIAVLAEPGSILAKHRGNLLKCLTSQKPGNGAFRVAELMNLQNYPTAERISAFYAQSVSLVEYLASLKGPQAFTQFMRDASQKGYEAALSQHYGVQGFADLQNRWVQYVQKTVAGPAYAGR